MKQVFGVFAALAIGWGLCAPASAQELFPLQAISGGGGTGQCSDTDSGMGTSLGLTCDTTNSDDFNGSSVDTSKWQITGGIPSGLPGPLCSPAATESGGALHIPVGGSSLCTGMAYATNPNLFQNSGTGASDYTEISLSFPSSRAFGHSAGIASYWAFGHLPSDQAIPEWDVFNESCVGGQQNNWFLWTSDPPWNPIGGATDCPAVSGWFGTDVHVMGLYRDGANQQMKFYWDGTLYTTYNDPYSGQYGNSSGQSIFNNQDMGPIFLACANGGACQYTGDGTTSEMTVYYIHYYH